jgi:phosphoglycolate phosphatase
MRHVFLDLDGTLTDPTPGITACFQYAASALGLAPLSAADVRRYIGPPLRDAFREILATSDALQIEQAVVVYRERFGSVGLFENSVYPGVVEALARLRRAGHPLSVVTSKAEPYAQRIVAHFGLGESLPNVFGAELSGERSTKAEQIAHALASLGITPAQACMVGDREHDVLGARVHGMRAIGVTWGFGSRGELEAAGAERVVDTFEQLVEAVHALDPPSPAIRVDPMP